MAERPHDIYYRACVGYWRCPFSIEVTDREVLASSYGVLDRLSFWMLSIWPAWLGQVHLHTSVRYRSPDEVIHTTRLRWLFLTMMSSEELIVLKEGGAFTLDGKARMATSFWKTQRVFGQGEVASDTVHADYQMTWMGAPLRQRTAREEDRVTLTMEGQGFVARQPLARQPGRPESFL